MLMQKNFIDALSISNTGDISLPVDNKKLKFGAGDDLTIYHNGANHMLLTVQVI
ncbi:MAG: hypothetical protein CM15mL2_0140 [Caudoviricetes sp.]|nr:MAG: hypothetical protein CM15mL2_0140 [Caudoviricetes sp.]